MAAFFSLRVWTRSSADPFGHSHWRGAGWRRGRSLEPRVRRSALLAALALVAFVAGCGGRVEELGAAPAPGVSEPGAEPGCVGAGVDCADAGLPCNVDVVVALDASDSMSGELEAVADEVLPGLSLGLLSITGARAGLRLGILDACPEPASFRDGDEDACVFEGRQVWIEGASTKLLDEFECATEAIGEDAECSDGEDGQPVSSAIAALEPPYGSEDNRGFLREGALLVVLAGTDQDEQPTGSAQTAQQLFDRLRALKPQDPDSVVFIGMGGSQDCEGEYGAAGPATRLRDVVNLFAARGRGVGWDLCAGKLRDEVNPALAVIRNACAGSRTRGAGEPR